MAEKGLSTGEAYKLMLRTALEKFESLIEWNTSNYDDYKILLRKLKISRGDIKATSNDETTDNTKDVGDALENLVNFIINKSFFFKVTSNIRTGSNEIDEVITLTKDGKAALEYFNIPRSYLVIEDNLFLGECKNYKTPLSVTYVGKFYSLMKQCDCNLGIMFTYKGLSGKETSWNDSHGLTKVLRLIEKHSSNNPNFYILEFKLEDYEAILEGKTFFELVSSKMIALQISANHNKFLEEPIDDDLHELINYCKENK